MSATCLIRVVVIDDDPAFRHIVALSLEDDPRFVHVGEAAGGLEALGAVDRGNPDVVLLDLHLPSINGLSLLRLLRDRDSQLVVVVVTADEELIEQALAGGATAVFVKGNPVTDILDCADHHHRLRHATPDH